MFAAVQVSMHTNMVVSLTTICDGQNIFNPQHITLCVCVCVLSEGPTEGSVQRTCLMQQLCMCMPVTALRIPANFLVR